MLYISTVINAQIMTKIDTYFNTTLTLKVVFNQFNIVY